MHRELLAAVRTRDVSLASQSMRDHFRSLETRMARAIQLSQTGVPSRPTEPSTPSN